MKYKTIPIQNLPNIFYSYHLLQKLVDMHDQYDEEAEDENGKDGLMKMTMMLKNLVLYLWSLETSHHLLLHLPFSLTHHLCLLALSPASMV